MGAPKDTAPDGLDEFLAEGASEPTPQPGPTPDMNAAPISTPVTQAVDALGSKLSQMGNVDKNLNDFNELVNRARSGDASAQAILDQHMASQAMGTVGQGPVITPMGSGPITSLGTELNSGLAQELGQGSLTPAMEQAVQTQQVGTNMARAENNAKALAERKTRTVKGYASGGPVTDPLEPLASAAPPGLDEFIAPELQEEKYGTPGQQAIAGVEGVAKGLAGPLATGAERLVGVKPEDISGREEENPVTHGAGELLGLAGPALLTAGASTAARAGLAGAGAVAKGAEALSAVTQGGLLEKAGAAGAAALGLGGEAAPIISQIGSKAVAGAIDNALYQVGDETSKRILNDPNSVGDAVMHVGLAGLIGGAAGGGLGSISPLWKATLGAKTDGVLKAAAEHVGGIEGVESDPVRGLVEQYAPNLAPEVKAALHSDRAVQEMASVLNQTDTNSSGLAFQKARKEGVKQLGDSVVESLGVTPENVPRSVDRYETGKDIGQTLADEYQSQLDPAIAKFEEVKAKYKDAPLLQDGVVKPDTSYSALGAPGAPALRTPGTVTEISDGLAKLADTEGWVGSKTDIENEFQRVMKALPQKKTLSELTGLITQVGNNTKSTLPFGAQTPLSRAGQLMKKVLSEAEDRVALQHLGKEAPELIEKFQSARASYRQQSLLREQLNDRLHAGGSTSGFAKSVREMANTDGESLLRRLSGKTDAHLLDFLQQNFPKTAEAVKQYHVNELLAKAAGNAGEGRTINLTTLKKELAGMSPQLRDFAIPPEVQDRVEGISTIMERLDRNPFNSSNTARTGDKLMGGLAGSAVGLATMIAGHNPATAVLAGILTKTLGKDVPDAVRLGLLKFLGSSKPVNGPGFKAMVDLIHATQKGQSLLTNGAKNVFKASTKVIPEHLFPDDMDRAKLDKQVKALQVDPTGLTTVGNEAGHYMPDHGTALAQTATQAVSYLNSIRPNTDRKNPLDAKPIPSSTAKAQYDRALAIAAQPLVTLQHLQNGSLTSQDLIHLKNMYPAALASMQSAVSKEMMNAVSKGVTIPYKTKLGLSLFMGQALDSSMTQQGIVSAQPVSKGANSQQPQQGTINKPKRGTAVLSKIPNQFRTPGQSAEYDRQSRE